MKDKAKTKAQLLDELTQLRQRLAELEAVAQNLRESEERCRFAFNSAGDLVCIYGLTEEGMPGRIIEVNDTGCETLGYSREELTGMSRTDLWAPEEVEHIPAIMAKLKSEGRALFETTLAARDGTGIPVEASAQLVSFQGQPAVLSISRDIRERKREEEALSLSERRFKDLADSIPDLFFALDSDFRYTYWNEASERATGIAAEEAIGKSLYDLFPAIRNTRAEELYKRVLRTGQPAVEESKYSMGGEVHVFELVAYPSAGGVAVLARDITQRKRAEEQVAASEAKYRAIFDGANDAIFVADPDTGYILDANQTAERLLGRTRDEIVGMHQTQLHPPEKLEEYAEQFRRHVEQGRAAEFEAEVLRKDGSRIPVFISASVVGLPDGRIIQGRFTDITELRQAQEALLKSEARFRELADSLPETVFEMDATGVLTFANRTSFQTFGYTQEDMERGLNVLEMLIPEDRPQAMAAVVEIMDGRQIGGREYTALRKDGTTFPVIVHASSVMSGDRPVGLRGIVIDLTELREAQEELRRKEEQLRESQKMEAIGRLAGGVAHDFNNLLTVISGHSQLMLEKLGESEPLHRSAGRIYTAAERAATLTRQLLAFSRRQVLEPEVLDLNAVVADMDKILRRVIGEDIDLLTVLDPDLGRTKADRGQIEQVILNLAVNARDAMPQGGKLTLETSNVHLGEEYAGRHVAVTPGPHVMLAVSDSGIGMDEETKSQVFEPFFTTKEGATGLGLATVYGTVKQSGGNIWVYSEPGQGTVFKVYLPRVEGEAELPKPTTIDTDALRGTETILVVEDEDMVRELTREILRMKGYTVIDAGNPSEAILTCERHEGRIDLMLTDVVMPQMSGREVAEKVVALRPDMKVLYMSGYTDNAIVHQGALDPGVAFIHKPFAPDSLAGKVREVLDAPTSKDAGR